MSQRYSYQFFCETLNAFKLRTGFLYYDIADT